MFVDWVLLAALHELNEKIDYDFFLLQEMHIYKTQADVIEKDFKGQCFWLFGIGKCAGSAILVSPKFSGNILCYIHNTDVDSISNQSGHTFLLTDADKDFPSLDEQQKLSVS